MLELSGYRFKKIVSSGPKTTVYRALRKADRRLRLVKVTHLEGFSNGVDRLKWENTVLGNLNLSGVLEEPELVNEDGQVVLTFADFDGVSWEIFCGQNFEVESFLTIAINVVEVLGDLHQNNVVHQNINPHNIFIDPRDLSIRLDGFGYSTRFTQQQASPQTQANPVEDHAYMAPEQTGRMNANLDYRIDWYSLGATFYRAITGKPPFIAADPLELIHAHIAQSPPPVHLVNPNIPQALSDIVGKLLAKQPEERYQSKHGLKTDLVRCLAHYRSKGAARSFTLGTDDVSSTFLIPQKIYGREEEISRLNTQFEAAVDGQKNAVLVSGYSGVGKTSVVHEMQRTLAAGPSHFLSGKYDQFQRNLPYSALIQAFQNMVRQILATGSEQVAEWKHAILDALGANGKLLLDVIPELVPLLGQLPEVPPLPPGESQSRFMGVFSKFVCLFASPEAPLVLFLDDLQWADLPSLDLLESLMQDPDINHLMVICCFRQQEVSEDHPFRLMVDRMRTASVKITDLPLLPLSVELVGQMIGEVFGKSTLEDEGFARICHEKTGGNPFFLRQFLTSLHEKKLLFFDGAKGCWSGSLDKISQTAITENVADLMAEVVGQVAAETRELLKVAACIGNQFDLGSLALISGRPALEIRGHLFPALVKGLILPKDEQYKFLSEDSNPAEVAFVFQHDRIQQAVDSLMDPQTRQQIHLKFGRILLDTLNPEELQERLFEVVSHLYQGLPLIDGEEEGLKMAGLFLRAGSKAKDASAFKLAARYLESGLKLVGEASWQTHYDLLRDLHLETAEACYFHNRLKDMEHHLKQVLDRTQKMDEIRRVYEIRIEGYVASYDWVRSYQVGLEGLASLGLTFPEKIKDEVMMGYLADASAAIDKVGLKAVIELPKMQDELRVNQVRLMAKMMTPAFHIEPNLFVVLAAKFVTLSMEHGHMEQSSFMYTCYCILLVNDDPERAYRLGNIAVLMANQFKSFKAKGRTLFTVYGNVSYRKDPIGTLVERFLEPYPILMESGDVEFASFTLLYYLMFIFLAGEVPLDQLEGIFERWCKVLKKLQVGFPTASSYFQAIHNLRGKSEHPHLLIGSQFDRQKMRVILKEKQDSFSEGFLYTLEMMMFYLFGQYSEARKAGEEAKACGVAEAHEYNTSMFFTFYSLSLLADGDGVTEDVLNARLQEVDGYQASMSHWAKHAPGNFLSRWHLVEAEKARVKEDIGAAISHFDQAVENANRGPILWERGLAQELMGRFWVKRDSRYLAGVSLRAASSFYAQWGASAKVSDMQREYGALLDPVGDEVSVADQNWAEFDLSSVFKATQVLSGEIVFADVLRKLVHIAMENAGAQRGFLLFENKGQWILAAEGDAKDTRVSLDHPKPLGEAVNLSVAICRYVINTGKTVMLEDACRSQQWGGDPYVLRHRPKSLLCMAILRQGAPMALLYLENNLRSAVFTRNHKRVLGMLAAQAAVSLENAQLYASLEQKVDARTKEVHAKNEHILSSIYYAKRIQEAILPDLKSLKTEWLDLFVTYLPKDIVSGDFYWVSRQGRYTFIAAIDCTGHGVPGALMAMVGHTLLNQIVNEGKVYQPKKILEILTARVRTALAIHTPRSSEGMEMICCRIDGEGERLVFAGARRPLYIVRKGFLLEIKGVRRTIGDLAVKEQWQFVEHQHNLCKGDMFYLTSDGYTDQAGAGQMRFGRRRFRKMLKEISEYDLSYQRNTLEQALLAFKGNIPQRDDITVLGVRIVDDSKMFATLDDTREFEVPS